MNYVLLLVLLIAALIAAMFGQGGGVLYTPIQVWFGTDFHTAATNSLFLIVVTSFAATITYRKAKETDWKMSLILEAPTTAGAYIGGYISDYISSKFLSVLLLILLVVSAYYMLKPIIRNDVKKNVKPGFWILQRNFGGAQYSLNLALLFPIVFAIGLFTGMVGIGGGILKVPALVILGGVPMNIAVGSSAFMVGLTAAGGLLGHISVGHLDWHSSFIMAIAVFIGSQLGSRIATGLDKGKLKKFFAIFLLLVAISLIIKIL
jgi:uncharacterized membrane protein YfcA